jgi:hypothetical protein
MDYDNKLDKVNESIQRALDIYSNNIELKMRFVKFHR